MRKARAARTHSETGIEVPADRALGRAGRPKRRVRLACCQGVSTTNVRNYQSHCYWMSHGYDRPSIPERVTKSDSDGTLGTTRGDEIDREALASIYVARGGQGEPGEESLAVSRGRAAHDGRTDAEANYRG